MKACLLSLREPSLCAPLTSNRDLGDCLIANVPLRDLLTTELTRAGFQVVVPHQSDPHTVHIPLDHWVEIGALIMLGRTTLPTCLHDGRHHFSMIHGQPVDTGRVKFGCIIGDGVKTGVNTSIEAGVKIGVARVIKSGTCVAADIM